MMKNRFEKVGRNDPCPCGSGNKFKKCCLGKAGDAPGKTKAEYAQKYGIEYTAGKRPWSVACDLAFPCATQNELNGQDATMLVENGCIAVAEGANMPTDKRGCEVFLKTGILYAPSKAANAGGVAVSGLEMTQNSMRLAWSREDVDRRLRKIIDNIHAQCVQYGSEKDIVNYHNGANIAGFIKVADAMIDQGLV